MLGDLADGQAGDQADAIAEEGPDAEGGKDAAEGKAPTATAAIMASMFRTGILIEVLSLISILSFFIFYLLFV